MVSKSGMYFSELDKWVPHPKVAEIVQRTHFKVFLNLESTFLINRSLLRSILNKFDATKSCFTVQKVDLCVTLEDVLYITGLPVDGEPVIGGEVGDYKKLVIEKLGKEPDKADIRGNKIKLIWLRERFTVVPEDADNNLIMKHFRAYILYILGCFLFPDPTAYVPILYLSILNDEEQINSYAWGSALLAYLISSMRSSSAKVVGSSLHCYSDEVADSSSGEVAVHGCTALLVLFFLIRIPALMSAVMKEPESGEPKGVLSEDLKFPVMVGLCDRLKKPSKNKYSTKGTDFTRLINEKEINFRPYDALHPQFLPIEYQAQKRLFSSYTTMVCFEKVAHHRADLASDQLGIPKGKLRSWLKNVPDLPSLVGVKERRSGKKAIDWRMDHKVFVDRWLKRWDHCFLSESTLHNQNVGNQNVGNKGSGEPSRHSGNGGQRVQFHNTSKHNVGNKGSDPFHEVKRMGDRKKEVLPSDSHARQSKGAATNASDKKITSDDKQGLVSNASARVQLIKPNKCQKNLTVASTGSVVGVYSSSTGLAHVPSPDSRSSGVVGDIRREVGVVHEPKQLFPPSCSNANNSIVGEDLTSADSFQSVGAVQKSGKLSQTAVSAVTEPSFPVMSVSRPSLNNQNNSRAHQQLLVHQRGISTQGVTPIPDEGLAGLVENLLSVPGEFEHCLGPSWEVLYLFQPLWEFEHAINSVFPRSTNG